MNPNCWRSWDEHIRMGIFKTFFAPLGPEFNLNVDLMFGLPGQTFGGMDKNTPAGFESGPSLGVWPSGRRSTYFHGSGVQADDDLQADLYEAAAEILESAGYVHYEISNFARPGLNAARSGSGEIRSVWALVFPPPGTTAYHHHTNTDDLTTYMASVEKNGTPNAETVELTPINGKAKT